MEAESGNIRQGQAGVRFPFQGWTSHRNEYLNGTQRSVSSGEVAVYHFQFISQSSSGRSCIGRTREPGSRLPTGEESRVESDRIAVWISHSQSVSGQGNAVTETRCWICRPEGKLLDPAGTVITVDADLIAQTDGKQGSIQIQRMKSLQSQIKSLEGCPASLIFE